MYDDEYNKQMKRYGNGAAKKGLWLLRNPVKGILLIILILGVIGIVGKGCGMAGFFVNDAVKTAKKEFSPSELLRKYEWFKDASAQLDKKQADIKVFEVKLTEFDGLTRKEMDRTDKEQKAQWQVEVAGIRSSYNDLAYRCPSQRV
jgi:hypothetical protein